MIKVWVMTLTILTSPKKLDMKIICRILSSLLDKSPALNFVRGADFALPYKYPTRRRVSRTMRGELNESASSMSLATREGDWTFRSLSNAVFSVSSADSRHRMRKNNSMASSPHIRVGWIPGRVTVGSALCETEFGA